MCGIFGIVSQTEFSSKELVAGLKKLEYRGYDSAGLAMQGDNLYVEKSVGKVEELEKKLKSVTGKVGISHTRWSTTGAVTLENAHPHLDCTGEIAVVHNGIVENYLELKKNLIAKGHKLKSETDTEVIPHLIEDNLHLGWANALEETAKLLEGRNTFLAMREKNEIAAFKNGSPLIIGMGKDRFFVSSDALPFLEYTNKTIFLEDGDLVFIGDKVRFSNGKEPTVQEVEWTAERAQKGAFPHFLIKEIMEQPVTLEKSILQNEEHLREIATAVTGARGSFFTACGTAGYAALTASYFFAKIAQKHVNFCVASEFPSYKHFLTDKSLVLAFSQSGETADTLDAIAAAKEKNAKVVGIVNVPSSSQTRQSDHYLLTNAGPEIAVCSTKAFTAQLSVGLLLAYAAAGKFEEGKKLLKDTAKNLGETLNDVYLEKIKSLAKILAKKQHIYVIGKGFNYPTALEIALKIKEVSYIHAEGFASGELKHGVITLIEKGTPCIAIIANDENKTAVLTGATEIKARGGYIIGIAPENNAIFDFWIPVPDVGNASPIVNAVPGQLLAYYLGVELGYDVDFNRNLAKSVTVR